VAEPIVAEVDASFGQNCYKEENEFKQMCDAGYTKVGADRDGAKCDGIDESLCGRIICCPKTSGMTECSWRGSGGDCNGQCHEGEVKVSSSSYGGHPGESSETKKCNRGDKAFCCKTTQYASLTEGCRWTDKCGNECNSDEESVAYAYDHWGWGTVFCHGNHYCCKKDRPIPFKNCHWVGKGDCADNTCSKSEVTLWTNDRGDTYGGCSWGRKKALCCTPNADALEEHLCDFDPCKDDPDFCDDGGGEEVDIAAARLARRTYIDPEDGLEYSYLEKRGSARPGMPRKSELVTKAGKLIWNSRPYPTGDKRDKLFRVSKGLAAMTLRGGFR
jgi:chitinase